MKQKIFTLIASLILSAGIIHASVVNGTCGSNLTWSLNTQDSTLTIEGSGAMRWSGNSPWNEHRNNIAYISLPDGITSIYSVAFACSNIRFVTIPASVTTISYDAFYQCSHLQSINVAEENTVYTSFEGVLFSKNMTTLITYPNGRKGSYSIPDGVIYIGKDAFAWCDGLTDIMLPNSLVSIGESAFVVCKTITSITIPDNVTSIGNSAFLNCNNLSKVTLSANLEYMGNSVFMYCYPLDSITIPSSLTRIEGRTFEGCYNLKFIEIPSSVTTIGYSAFYKCYGLNEVIIGENVATIEDAAFYLCTDIISITSKAINPPTLGNMVFYNVNTSIPLYVPFESISIYEQTPIWQDFVNIYAIGTIIGTYRVEFHDLDGTILKVDSVNYGSSATAPANPYRQGYTFTGWDVDFSNITSDLIVTAQYELGEEKDFTIIFANGNDNSEILSHNVILKVPAAPQITGFTFIGWRPVAAIIESNTIEIEAVYQADEPSAIPSVVTNPANPAQKLIRDGNVYILRDDKLYTITGNVL